MRVHIEGIVFVNEIPNKNASKRKRSQLSITLQIKITIANTSTDSALLLPFNRPSQKKKAHRGGKGQQNTDIPPSAIDKKKD